MLRRRRGGALLMFLCVALPVVLLAASLAVDTARIITTRRKAAQVADAAALAGAQQLDCLVTDGSDGQGGTCAQYADTLDPTEAVRAADYVVGLASGRATVPGAAGLKVVYGGAECGTLAKGVAPVPADELTDVVTIPTVPGAPATTAPATTSPSTTVPSSPPTTAGGPKLQRVRVTLCYRQQGLLFLPAVAYLVGSGDVGERVAYVTRYADVCVPGQYQYTGASSCTRPAAVTTTSAPAGG